MAEPLLWHNGRKSDREFRTENQDTRSFRNDGTKYFKSVLTREMASRGCHTHLRDLSTCPSDCVALSPKCKLIWDAKGDPLKPKDSVQR